MKAFLRCVAAAFLVTSPVVAQIQLVPTPPPLVVADLEPWYVEGRPITHAGNIYYPAGAQLHFNANEMVRSGFFQGVPLYTRTTLEPYSIVFVPLSGGLMQPYERRRAGDIAGTVGSTAPSFPVVLPAEEANRDEFGVTLQAQGPPMRRDSGVEPSYLDLAALASDPRAAAAVIGEAYLRGSVPAGLLEDYLRAAAASRGEQSPTLSTLRGDAIGTAGETSANVPPLAIPPRTRIESAQRPVGLNGVFVTFENTRYFAGDPAVKFDPSQFEQAGDYKGFPVYRRADDPRAIYIALFPGDTGLLAVYRAR
jgi:hypothetical protein